MINVNEEVASRNRAYLRSAKEFFQKHSHKMVAENHYHHNIEPNYWKYMLEDLISKPERFQGGAALEYGCGAGRNLVNMGVLGGFARVDGLDIAKDNAINAQQFASLKLKSYDTKVMCLEGDGYTCLPLRSNLYDFVMSHQVFIHIPNYDVRGQIIREVKRVLKSGGVFICHFMTIGDSVGYFDNHLSFPKNVQPEGERQLKEDFLTYEFSEVKVTEVINFVNQKPEWYIRCVK